VGLALAETRQLVINLAASVFMARQSGWYTGHGHRRASDLLTNPDVPRNTPCYRASCSSGFSSELGGSSYLLQCSGFTLGQPSFLRQGFSLALGRPSFSLKRFSFKLGDLRYLLRGSILELGYPGNFPHRPSFELGCPSFLRQRSGLELGGPRK